MKPRETSEPYRGCNLLPCTSLEKHLIQLASWSAGEEARQVKILLRVGERERVREAEVNSRWVIKGSRNNVFARARGCTHRSRGTWHGLRLLSGPASSYESVGVAAPDSWERPRGNTVDGIARSHRIAVGTGGIFPRNLLKSEVPSLESRQIKMIASM